VEVIGNLYKNWEGAAAYKRRKHTQNITKTQNTKDRKKAFTTRHKHKGNIKKR